MPCYDPEPLKGVVASIKAAARPLALEFLKRAPELVVEPSAAGAEAAEAQPSDEDMYSPSGGTRGGGTKVLAKAVSTTVLADAKLDPFSGTTAIHLSFPLG